MFLFSFSSVHALEVSQWGQYNGEYIDSINVDPWYTYSEYNSDTIMNFIYEKSNQQFFDNSKTIEEFYSEYTYIIQAYSSSTIRVLVQNYNRVTDYQGISPIEGQPIKFYFANMTTNKLQGTYWYYYGGISAIYSYYLDINYNTKSYSFSNNNPLIDVNFYDLSRSSKYVSISNPTSDYSLLTLYLNCFDSYNNNFAWIDYWDSVTNNSSLWSQITGFSGQSYYNYPTLEIPDLLYTSSGVGPVVPDEPEEPGSDNSEVVDKIEESNTILGAILDKVNEFLDYFKSSSDISPLENLLESFIIEDFGEENFFLLIIGFLEDIKNSTTSCSPIIIDLPFVSDNIVLPCMTEVYEDISPQFLSFYQLITTGLISFGVIINVFDTISILLDPTTDLWFSNRQSNSDIVSVDAKTGEVIS